jgi:dihydroflavonol-4-reductase
MTDQVLVTGGSGYIAGFVIQRLLADGFTIKTTLRSRSRETELRERLGADGHRLTVVEADLTADAGWDHAMVGCSHVAHVASPLPLGVPRHADELIVPARDGVLRALRAAQGAGVRRFVMTSSVAALSYGRGRGEHRFTEADWTDPDAPGLSAYVRSKTIAERAARDWIARQTSRPEFCSICPSVVLGPVWSGDYSASLAVVQMLLDGRMRACPDIGFGLVDVRDVADLHVKALLTPGLDGERFIASGRFMKLLDIAAVLHRELGADARRVPTRRLPDWVVRLAARFHPVPRAIVGELGSVRHLDASHAKRRLGWEPRPVEASIVDAARSLLALGIVKP